jgi:hypothetical protein
MATPDKDLEELKKEHKDLSDQLRRGAILSLTVLSLFVISFSRACQKANGNDAKIKLCQIQKLTSTTGRIRNVSYIFDQFESFEDCDEPCPTPTPSPEQATGAPTATTTTANSSQTPQPSPTESPTVSGSDTTSLNPASIAQVTPTPDAATKKLASDCQNKLEADLEESAEKWFSVEAPVPGIKVTLDLRYWVFLLPPLYFLTGIYLHILRMKLRLVEAVGAHELNTVERENASELHLLYFDKQSPYKRFPGDLGGLLFVIIYLFLPLYLIVSGVSFSSYWSADSFISIGFVFGVLTLYSVSYAHFVTNRIDHEIARVTNQPVPGNFIRAALMRIKNLLQKIAGRLSPRIPLSTGSVLLFITLGLTISQNSCEEKRYRGYQVLIGEEGAEWYTSFGLFGSVRTLRVASCTHRPCCLP